MAGPALSGMKGYTTKDVARILGLSEGQVRGYARAGFLEPRRGSRNEFRFSFPDLVLLRAAKGLVAARIPTRKVRRALRDLKRRLPRGRPLSGVRIAAHGERIIVRHEAKTWDAVSGQAQFDFDVAELAAKVEPYARRAAREAEISATDLDAEDWFMLAQDFEVAAPDEARSAYERVLELQPDHVDARVNLGRLLHETGKLEAAELHYRLVLAKQSRNATALFNLGVCLEDLNRAWEAMRAYREAIAADGACADAYYNLARLMERAGDAKGASRHFKAYRRLTESP
jgi:tetratricopeptide (TPR) repeat protein